MSETPGTYAGHEGPLADWPCQAYDQLTVAVADNATLQAENAQVWALALAYMPVSHGDILRALAWLHTLDEASSARHGGERWITYGWASHGALQHTQRHSIRAAMPVLIQRGLVEFWGAQNCYRLTTLGQQVAVILAGKEK